MIVFFTGHHRSSAAGKKRPGNTKTEKGDTAEAVPDIQERRSLEEPETESWEASEEKESNSTAEDCRRAYCPAEECAARCGVTEIQPILQEPELPTGCESVALTMALEYLGFELEKTTIADQYLIRSATNFAEGVCRRSLVGPWCRSFPSGSDSNCRWIPERS